MIRELAELRMFPSLLSPIIRGQLLLVFLSISTYFFCQNFKMAGEIVIINIIIHATTCRAQEKTEPAARAVNYCVGTVYSHSCIRRMNMVNWPLHTIMYCSFASDILSSFSIKTKYFVENIYH